MQYNQYLETGVLSLYYVLPLFRRGPDSRYIEKFNDWYQAVPVHMDQEDIAKHLALLSGVQQKVKWTERKAEKISNRKL